MQRGTDRASRLRYAAVTFPAFAGILAAGGFCAKRMNADAEILTCDPAQFVQLSTRSSKNCSATSREMESLIRKIEDRLQTHRSCRIFSPDVNRVWPMSSKEKSARDQRIEQIRQFAESHGWSVVIHDPGFQAVFRRKQ
jgi:hypothetical protein